MYVQFRRTEKEREKERETKGEKRLNGEKVSEPITIALIFELFIIHMRTFLMLTVAVGLDARKGYLFDYRHDPLSLSRRNV